MIHIWFRSDRFPWRILQIKYSKENCSILFLYEGWIPRPSRAEFVKQKTQTLLVLCSKVLISRSNSETSIHVFYLTYSLTPLLCLYRSHSCSTTRESSLIRCPTWKRLLIYHKSGEKSVSLMSFFHVLRFHQDFQKRSLPLEMTGEIHWPILMPSGSS